MVKIWTSLATLCLGLTFTGCERKAAEIAPEKSEKPPLAVVSPVATNVQTYPVKGVVVEIKSDGKTAKIKHEEIPGFMAAMTMDLEVRDPHELRGLQAGDAISFRMLVTENDGWIDQVRKLNTVAPTELPSRQAVRRVKDVEPLQEGDLVPDYHFTNELGKAVSLRQFKGQALAITFIFTTCPYPVYCPRMSQNFSVALKKLRENADGPKNWRLLSISFDPEKDTPETLKAYAERYDYDPAQWSFLTGDLLEITAISEQFGLMFWREAGTINHNLRTVVIDTQGRVQKIFPANEWKGEALAEEIVKAAAVK